MKAEALTSHLSPNMAEIKISLFHTLLVQIAEFAAHQTKHWAHQVIIKPGSVMAQGAIKKSKTTPSSSRRYILANPHFTSLFSLHYHTHS